MKVISVINRKGGAGKTISAVNIAYAMNLRNKKILLIDTDPSRNISTYLGIDNENTLYELIKEYYENFKITKSKYINTKNSVDIIISNEKLLTLEKYFSEKLDEQAIFNIYSNITKLFSEYDYIILDTEGTINNMIRGVLNATNYIIAPSKTSLIDTNGIIDLIKIYQLGKRNNPGIELKKVFLVHVEENTKVFKDAVNEYEEFFNSEFSKDLGLSKNIFSKKYIRKDSEINNAMLKNLDVINYKKTAKASIDYKNIADELLEEIELCPCARKE